MSKNKNKTSYDDPKEFNGESYTGMRVGGKHSWNYKDGTWNEIKIAPEEWKFQFSCNKYRIREAPLGSGAPIKTGFHWYIFAHQKVVKLDENTYETLMQGLKFKLGHKRPNWKFWSYEYKNESEEDKVIQLLESVLEKLKARKKRKEVLSFLE